MTWLPLDDDHHTKVEEKEEQGAEEWNNYVDDGEFKQLIIINIIIPNHPITEFVLPVNHPGSSEDEDHNGDFDEEEEEDGDDQKLGYNSNSP